MPHVNNVNFPESKFALLFQHTTKNNFRKLKQHLMKEWSTTHRRHCVVSLSKNINPSLVLVQPRKTHPFITEILLMGRKESNQTNEQSSHIEYINLVSKSSVLAPNHITVNYLHFALSIETEIIDNFQINPYQDNSAVPL